jgi:hypothetical protein
MGRWAIGKGQGNWEGTEQLDETGTFGKEHEHWEGTGTLGRDRDRNTGKRQVHWEETGTLGRERNTGKEQERESFREISFRLRVIFVSKKYETFTKTSR